MLGGETVDSTLVLIVAPSGRDGTLTEKLLRDGGIEAEVCRDVAELCGRIGASAAVALIDERVLDAAAMESLRDALKDQGDWSDFPIVVFSARSTPRRNATADVGALGNVTFLDRPVQVRTMLAAVQAAIRARQRQYQVRRAIALREQFLAMLGHELRNPLASIRLAVEAMEQTGGGDSPRQRSVIDRQSLHLARLVDDLLDVARVTHGKVVLQRGPLDIAELVRACFLAHRPAASRISYSLSGADEDHWVEGDHLRLEQIVNNLLTNAIKYTPRGSVNVELRTESGSVALHVRDSGIGIAPETLPRVFDLFSQADRSLDRAQGGLGLGLAVVRGLVDLHGGEVEARSAGLGHGSEFIVTLPRVAKPEARETSSAAPTRRRDPRRVVIVDDNEDLREMLEVLLVSAGHDVTTAEDGPSGLEQILERKPDVALVDLGLPGFDGYELARRARAAGQTMLLVAVSGYGQPEDRRRALAAGFDEHLKKPVAFEDLESAILRTG